MKTNFDKAHNLITKLEEKLHATTSLTTTAREALNKWMQAGGVQMRKRSAAALKEARKKADQFNKALVDLEKKLSRSMDKLAKSLEKPAIKKTAGRATRARSKQGRGIIVNVTAAPLAEKKISRPKPPSRSLRALNMRIQSNDSGRGRRRQAARDAK